MSRYQCIIVNLEKLVSIIFSALYVYIPKLVSIMALKLVFLKESAKANTARCKHREYCYEVRVDQKKLTVK